MTRASRPALDESAWNFSNVADSELVACCFWEYAQESKTMRDAVKTAKRALASQGKPRPETPEREDFREDANRAFGLLYQTGFPLEFWTGLPFPKPWQLISEALCKKWAGKCPDKFADAVKFPAFQVTDNLNTAAALHGAAKEASNARNAICKQLAEIDRGVSNLDEAAKLRARLAEYSPLKIQGAGGVDSFIMQINWAQFSKPEIKACFGKWVDSYACPIAKPGERGKKDTTWRTRVERLGLLRLRREYTFEQSKPFLARLYPPVKGQGKPPRRFDDKGECNREATKAGEDFRFLFPFLAEPVPCKLMD